MSSSVSMWNVATGVLIAIIAIYFLLPTKERASAECDSRAIEHSLVGTDKSRHKNLCMIASGFKRNTVCEDGHWNQEADRCYSYGWEIWVEGAVISR